MSERDPIHDLLDEAAKHREGLSVEFRGIIRRSVCIECDELWPCLVTRLAAEVHALRKQQRDTTPCVCD